MMELMMVNEITNEAEFSNFVLNGKTVKELEEIYKCSRNQIYIYKRKYDLIGKTPNSNRQFIEDGYKTCNICMTEKPLSDFYSNGKLAGGGIKYKPSCKPCSVSKKRKITNASIKTILIEQGRDYKCELCGYDKNYAAIEFHHIDPTTKLFEIANYGSSAVNIDTIRSKLGEELKKCAVLCSNCHREFHNPLSMKE